MSTPGPEPRSRTCELILPGNIKLSRGVTLW